MTAPTLTFDQAERVGQALCDRWHTITGKAPMADDSMAWGDIVQFVLRTAGEVAREDGEG